MPKHRKSFMEYSANHRRRIANELARELMQKPVGVGVDEEDQYEEAEIVEVQYLDDVQDLDYEDQVDLELKHSPVWNPVCEIQSVQSLLDQRENRPQRMRSVLTAPPSVSSGEDELESLADGISDASRDLKDNRDPLMQVDSTQILQILERMANSMERIENKMKSLSARVLSLEKVQKALYDTCNKGLHTIPHQPQISTLSFHLPSNHWDEFSEIMEKVGDEEVKRQLITFLSKVGGKDLTSLVNSVLLKLLTNNLAQKCNWKGQRGNKHALEKTPLLTIVHGAVISHVGWENTTEDEVKGRIQNWLKQASRRYKTSKEEGD